MLEHCCSYLLEEGWSEGRFLSFCTYISPLRTPLSRFTVKGKMHI